MFHRKAVWARHILRENSRRWRMEISHQPCLDFPQHWPLISSRSFNLILKEMLSSGSRGESFYAGMTTLKRFCNYSSHPIRSTRDFFLGRSPCTSVTVSSTLQHHDSGSSTVYPRCNAMGIVYLGGVKRERHHHITLSGTRVSLFCLTVSKDMTCTLISRTFLYLDHVLYGMYQVP